MHACTAALIRAPWPEAFGACTCGIAMEAAEGSIAHLHERPVLALAQAVQHESVAHLQHTNPFIECKDNTLHQQLF